MKKEIWIFIAIAVAIMILLYSLSRGKVEVGANGQTCTKEVCSCPSGYQVNEDTGLCRQWIESSEKQTTDAECTANYHYQNGGNWNQRCHRNAQNVQPNCWYYRFSSWHASCDEHVAPIGCPTDYYRVGSGANEMCTKTVDTSHWSDDSAKVCEQQPIDCPDPTAEPTAIPTAEPTVEPTPTGVEPTPTAEPTKAPERVVEQSVPVFFGDNSAPSCGESAPMNLPANALVWRSGNDAIVQWQPTGGRTANIYYYNVKDRGDAHSVRDTENDGYVRIGLLGSKGWTFGIQQSNGCAGGPIKWIVDGVSRQWTLFR